MPLEKLYEMCDNEDTPELMREVGEFEKRIGELLHNRDSEVEVWQSLVDVIAAAERKSFAQGFKCAVNLIIS